MASNEGPEPRRLTFVQRFVGHAVDIARAAFRDQPLHHRVDAGSPVGTPHAPTAKTDGVTALVVSNARGVGKRGRAAAAHLV